MMVLQTGRHNFVQITFGFLQKPKRAFRIEKCEEVSAPTGQISTRI